MKSFITSPASPQATATNAAIRNSAACAVLENAATSSSTISPKISMGSMPVCPTLWALMAVVTNVSATTTTLTSGDTPSPKQSAKAAAATNNAASPAREREDP